MKHRRQRLEPAPMEMPAAAEAARQDASGKGGEKAAGDPRLRRVFVAVIAAATLGGAILGIGGLAGARRQTTPDQIPDATGLLSASAGPQTVEEEEDPGGPMLEVPCGDAQLPGDDGVRTAELDRYSDDSEEHTVMTFDLTNTAPGDAEPEIRLTRYLKTKLRVRSDPVTDAADRDYLISILRDTEYDPTARMPEESYKIQLEIGGERCSVFPDGTVVSDRGVGKADYLRVSALAWKYDTRGQEGSISSRVLSELINGGSLLKTTNTRFCFTGPDLHVDLDRKAARKLLRSLLGGTSETGENLQISPDLTPAPFDWEPAGTPICMTMYWEEREWTAFDYLHSIAHPEEENERITTYRFLFCPDGTLALPDKYKEYSDFGSSYSVYSYQLRAQNTQNMPWCYEEFRPAWPRPYLIRDAFDWDELISALEQLAASGQAPS